LLLTVLTRSKRILFYRSRFAMGASFADKAKATSLFFS
jgi:hypothetical protein